MAMVAVLEAIRYRPSFAGALSQFAMPCLLYAGEDDEGPFESGPNAAQRIPNARFFSLPGMNHVGASAAVELVLPEVRSFLSGVGGISHQSARKTIGRQQTNIRSLLSAKSN
jgi:pimeloyl-ACP methyl ester carboxylesterase